MNTAAKRDWGMIVSGIALVIVGLVFLVVPGLTLVAIAVVAGIALLAMGIVDLIAYIRYHKALDLSGWALAYALASIVLGAAFVLHPLISASVIPWLAAACVAAFGVIEIITAIRLRSGKPRLDVHIASSTGLDFATSSNVAWGWMLFSGIVALICAVAFAAVPESFAMFLAFFLMMQGIMTIAHGSEAGKIREQIAGQMM